MSLKVALPGKNDFSNAARRYLGWTLLALAWFATMGWRPLLEPDEGRYAEIPREMIASGDWVTPRLNDVKYFEKPPLQYWATATAYSIFGVAEGSSRLWSCALAFLCLPLVFYFARAMHGSAEAGWAAVLALAINPYFAVVGQLNLLDSGLTFFLSAAVFAYLRSPQSIGRAGNLWLFLAAIALGLATLTKGLVALVLPGATLLLHALITRDFSALRRLRLQYTVPLYLLIALPWFWMVSSRNPEFPEFFFLREHFARYLTNISDRTQPFWYFLPLLALAFLPWAPYLTASIQAIGRAQWRDPRLRIQWFLAIWCGVVLVFFSVSHSKLAPYIQPLMPAMAVLLAPRIAGRIDRVWLAASIGAGLVAIIGIALGVQASRQATGMPIGVIAWAMGATVLSLVGVAGARFNRLIPALTSIVAFQLLVVSYSQLPPVRTTQPLLARMRPAIGPHTQLYSVDQYRQSLPPYLGRTLRLAIYQGELEFGLQQEPHKFIATLDEFEALWRREEDAIAFVDPPQYQELLTHGVPFREIARDDRSIVIARR